VANAIYPKYKQALLAGDTDISLTTGDVKITLMDNDALNTVYDPSHQFYSEILAVHKIQEKTFANKTVTNGVFNADDIVFTSITEGVSAESVVIWIDTGTPTSSRLVAFLDTNISGLPIISDGSNIDLTFNTNGIFQL
jgi:hypothetical protein